MKLSLTLPLAAVLFLGATCSALGHHVAGVIDSQGRDLIPCRYRWVDYLGGGLFFVEDLNEDQPLARTFTGSVLDCEGKTVPVSLPSGCTLSRVFIAKPTQFEKYKGTCRKLPRDTILEVHSMDGVGLSDMNGKVLLEPKFGRIDRPRDGFFPVYTGDGISYNRYEFTFNSSTGERKKGPPGCAPNRFNDDEVSKDELRVFAVPGGDGYIFGYMNKTGDVVIEPIFKHAQYFTNEGLAVVEIRDSENNPKDAYIDKSGTIVSPLYLSARPFENGYANVVEVASDSEQTLIDTQFKPMLKGTYRGGVRRVFDDLYAVRDLDKPSNAQGRGSFFKAVNRQGKILFDFPGALTSYPIGVGNHIECIAVIDAPGAKESWKVIHLNRQGDLIKTVAGASAISNEFGIKVVSNRVAQSEPGYSLLNRKGESVNEVKGGYFKVVSKDLIIKCYSIPEFHPKDWAARNPNGRSRFEMFGHFLRSYDLIGMPKNQVESLLGPPDFGKGRYSLLSGPCLFSWQGIELEYDEDEKVRRWTEVNRGSQSQEPHWITTNVVWAGPDDGSEPGPAKRVRPKEDRDRLSPRSP